MIKLVNLKVLKECELNYDKYSPKRDHSFLGWDDLMREMKYIATAIAIAIPIP